MRITHGQAQGQRPYQEDRYIILSDGGNTLVAVFDGHSGSQTVDKLNDELPILYKRYENRSPEDFIRTLYTTLDERTKDFEDGSTASMVFITPEKTIVAILGDSPVQ